MDILCKRLLAPQYGMFDPNKDKQAFKDFLQDIKEYAKHLENGDVVMYLIEGDYRTFLDAESRFAISINNVIKKVDPYGYGDAVESEEKAYAETLGSVRSVSELNQLYDNLSESYEAIYGEAMNQQKESVSIS